MPELPEVETVKRGIEPHITNATIQNVKLYRDKLRYELDFNLFSQLEGQKIKSVYRRGKHLIIQLEINSIIIHLGMSGTLQISDKNDYIHKKHDHIVIVLSNNIVIFYNDPRRFGYWFVTNSNPLDHKCFHNYGPEPLTDDFNSKYLFSVLHNKKQAIKTALMDNKNVVGVGNIYANESLFIAKLLPNRPACSVTTNEYDTLVDAIKEILTVAISKGGTTLKDYKNADGKPGYFTQKLLVYGKKSQNCTICESEIQSMVIAQRNTFFCPTCQS